MLAAGQPKQSGCGRRGSPEPPAAAAAPAPAASPAAPPAAPAAPAACRTERATQGRCHDLLWAPAPV